MHDGFCPVRIEAQNNHVAIAESLIKHGAEMEMGNFMGRSNGLSAPCGQ